MNYSISASEKKACVYTFLFVFVLGQHFLLAVDLPCMSIWSDQHSWIDTINQLFNKNLITQVSFKK